jgi:hypothetical protein
VGLHCWCRSRGLKEELECVEVLRY